MSFTILAIGVLGFIGAFGTVSKSIHVSKTRAVANNLLQEKIEAMKNISYYRLVVTTNAASATETGLPAFQYDPVGGFYPPETMTVGDIAYTRRVFVQKVSSVGGGGLTEFSHQDPDTGLKRITSYVIWQDAGKYRMQELQNIVNNPNRTMLTGTISGNVTVSDSGMGGTGLDSVVMVTQNASLFDRAGTAGAYSFAVSGGTYTLQATKLGYFPVTRQNTYVAESGTFDWDPNLMKMTSGTVSGTAYLRDHLVISQVVGAHDFGGFTQEWVEVYNPTTWSWTTSDLGLRFQRVSTIDAAPVNIFLTAPVAGAVTIASNSFCLFANTTTITLSAYPGFPVTASVLWNKTAGTNDVAFPGRFTAANPNVITTYNDNNQWGAGSVQLYRVSDGAVQDVVGWKGNGSSANPPLREGNAMNFAQGLNTDEQLYRYSSVASYNPANGPAYDTQDNDTNLGLQNPAGWIPKSHVSAVVPTITGTPAAGAYASADDGLSGAVTANSAGVFSIPSVATGTWTVSISSGTGYQQAAVTMTGAAINLGTVALTSSTSQGFVTGVVTSAQNGTPISGIVVQTAGGYSGTTSATGRYTIISSTGMTSVTANPGNISNSTFVSDTMDGVDIQAGVYTSGINFVLDSGGRVRGYVRVGTSPLPGVPVTASSGAVTAAETASDGSGYFILANISTGSYTIRPQLESGESSSPASQTVTVTTGTVWSTTFTVTSAFGYITGSLTSAGQPIRTGVLVMASTGSITSPPLDITNAVRTGAAKYYIASSYTDGTYELYVPGGSGTPVTYNVYGWFTTWSGQTPTITPRTTTANVTGGVTTSGRNLSW